MIDLNGKYTNYEAATLYSEILDGQLDVLIPKINSMNLQKKQEPIRETMESLLSYDLALYLQNISAGLKSGDAKTVQTALEYRKKSLKTYQVLEDRIKAISDDLRLNEALSQGFKDRVKWMKIHQREPLAEA